MLIFRFEHNRAVCDNAHYRSSGPSLTGHGIMTSCGTQNYNSIPKFGLSGIGPFRIMEHERCAVTVQQFDSWKHFSFNAKKIRDWDLVCYEVDDTKEGIDWRYDNNQIVFNPEFASYVGTMTVAEMKLTV